MLAGKFGHEVGNCWYIQRQDKHYFPDCERTDDTKPDADTAAERRRRRMHLPLCVWLIHQSELGRIGADEPRGNERDEQARKNRAGKEEAELARGHRRESFLSRFIPPAKIL